MSKQQAPTPPDPQATSAAQTGTNIGTAIANAQLNNMNQVGPDGTKTFSQTGTSSYTDPFTGKTYQIPQSTVTTTLSPAQQAIADQQNAAKLNLSGLANSQSSFLNDYMSKPFDGSNDATEARLMQLGRERLDPILQQRTSDLQSQLADQGIKLGSSAYDRAMTLNTQGSNDAYDNLLLTGHGQAFQEAQAERNQPINEITALMSGGQVSQPQFGATPTSSIPTTDTAGIINSNYANQLSAWQQNQQTQGGLVGGLFGLGAGLLKNPAIFASDLRVKRDVIRLSKTAAGYFKYAFRYIWDALDAPYHVGYMAQEVRNFVADAVHEIDGILALDYAKLEAI